MTAVQQNAERQEWVVDGLDVARYGFAADVTQKQIGTSRLCFAARSYQSHMQCDGGLSEKHQVSFDVFRQ